jgi:hypothetical protein
MQRAGQAGCYRTAPDVVEDLGYAGRKGRLTTKARVDPVPRAVAIGEPASSTLRPLGPAIFTAWAIAGSARGIVILTPDKGCGEGGSLATRS